MEAGETVFLTDAVPPTAVRLMAGALMASCAMALIIAVAVPFPETIAGPFVLTSASGAEPVKAPLQGSITSVYVEEGASVQRGDLLVTLRSDDVAVIHARIEKLAEEVAINAELERALVTRHKLSKPALALQVENAERALRAATARRRTLEELGGKLRQQREAGAITGARVMQHELEAADANMVVARLAGELDNARHELSEADSAMSAERGRQELSRVQLERQLSEARASLTALSGPELDVAAAQRGNQTLFEVRAPHAGVVTALGARSLGSIVDRGTVLCHVAQSGARLRAELRITERESARIRRGMTVKLRFHAFSYTRYGTRRARLTWVSPTPGEGYLTAVADPDTAEFVIDGQRKPLQAGMQGEARIVVGSTTLFQRMLQPLRAARAGLFGDR